jgi:hypothetical protein
LDRLSWDSPIWLTHEAEGELRFWLENIEKMNFEGSYFSQLTVEACKANMFSDASGVGYGGYIAKEAGKSMLGEVYGACDAPEACMSSIWRELEAVNRVLLHE